VLKLEVAPVRIIEMTIRI